MRARGHVWYLYKKRKETALACIKLHRSPYIRRFIRVANYLDDCRFLVHFSTPSLFIYLVSVEKAKLQSPTCPTSSLPNPLSRALLTTSIYNCTTISHSYQLTYSPTPYHTPPHTSTSAFCAQPVTLNNPRSTAVIIPLPTNTLLNILSHSDPLLPPPLLFPTAFPLFHTFRFLLSRLSHPSPSFLPSPSLSLALSPPLPLPPHPFTMSTPTSVVTHSPSMRYSTPVNMAGWLHKEGKRFRTRYKRYLVLNDGLLSNHHTQNSSSTWQVRVADCPFSEGPRSNEIIIHLPQRRISFFTDSTDDHAKWIAALKTSSHCGVDHFYRIGEVLGEGAFAQVKLAEDRKTNERCAIKIIKKHGHDTKEAEFMARETSIMKSVNHANIVNTVDIFDSPSQLYIVLEFMAGGELFDVIAEAGSFSEQQAAQVTRDVIKGVQYLHMHDIVHRDIKPENVLCVSKQWPLQVKLADFGLADFSVDGEINEQQQSMIGTPGYVAPEVVKREKYGPPVDMWAVGVLLYIMLSGKMPFYGRDDNACLRMIASGKYVMPDREWSKISADAISLVKGLLQLNPDKRLTANAALQHKWLVDANHLSTSPINNDLSGIHSSRRKFRKAVMATMTVGRIVNLAANSSGGGTS